MNSIEIYAIKDDTVLFFNSLYEIKKELNIDKESVNKSILNNVPVNGYYFRTNILYKD